MFNEQDHFPNSAEAHARRGAPFTFDSSKLVQLVRKIKIISGKDSDYAPSFDHKAKDPVENDIEISAANQIVILEGNYLLLDIEPWADICKNVDIRWFVEIGEDEAKQRLIRRHLATGLSSTKELARERVGITTTALFFS